MELSLFLAKAWGLLLPILCLAILRNQDRYLQMVKAVMTEPVLFFSGMVALLIGIPHVLAHNIWIADWRGLVTLMGWLMVAKGVIRIFFPQMVLRFIEKGHYRSWFGPGVFVFLLIGLSLLAIGFKLVAF